MAQRGRPKVEHRKDDKVTIRLTPDLSDRLDAYTSTHHIRKTQVLTKALEQYLDRTEADDKSQ